MAPGAVRAPALGINHMKARTSAPGWVQGVRSILRESVGPSYSVVGQLGKTRLTVRFSNGVRKSCVLEILWEKASTRKIQEQVEEIARLIDGGRSWDEVMQIIKRNSFTAPQAADEPEPDLLIKAYDIWSHDYMFKQTRRIEKSTLDGQYAKARKRLKEVSNAINAHDLLVKAGQCWEPGIRTRQQVIRTLAKFLRWGVSKDSDYILDSTKWEPKPKGSLSEYIGEKSLKVREKATAATVALEDDEILAIINSLPVTSNHPRDKKSAEQWQFALQLMSTFGLRPVEIHYLEVKVVRGQYQVWCNYCKKNDNSLGRPRRLHALPPEWLKTWNLVDRIANMTEDDLPRRPNSNVGEACRKYLMGKPIWKAIRENKAISPYSFRHGWSLRSHLDFGLSDTVSAKALGHTTAVHNQIYASYTTEALMDDAIEKGIKYRNLTRSNIPG